MKLSSDRKISLVLLGLGMAGVVSVMPYVATVQKDLLEASGVPLGGIFLAQLIQSFVLLAVTIRLGLWLAKKTGFKLPFLETLVKGGDYKNELRNFGKLAAGLGVAVALIIYGLDWVFGGLGAGISTHTSPAPVWQTLLASVYGGVVEEILMRLFLMSLLVWLGMKVWRQKKATDWLVWSCIILAAVIFGLGHLSITASLTTVNALVVTRAIVLNGVGGVVFGWLFWKKGLEAAMTAHLVTDVVLLTVLPGIVG